MRSPLRFLSAASVALAGVLCSAPASAQVVENYRVKMRDGVELSTDVIRPNGPIAARPVVLRRTPYGRALDASSVNGLLFYGYTVVSQDVRGRGDSGGEFLPFMNDAQDGADTIAWVASQPFCNGKVGSFSASAEGIVQLMAAGEGPPALECAHVGVATGDVYEGIMPGGAWRKELTTDWLLGLSEPAALAFLRGHEAADATWDPVRLTPQRRANVKAPVFLYGGFFDIFAKDTVKTHRLLQLEADASVRGDMFLVFGPWTHGGTTSNVQGEVTFPADAAYSKAVDEALAWFGWCLKGQSRPSWQAVRYYRLKLSDDGRAATGAWLGADAWPPPSTATTFYVHDDLSLSTSAPRDGAAAGTLHSDPASPIPSLGGGNLNTAAGPMDQSSVDALSNVMTATTLPATEEVTIVGDVTARVWAASSSTDADAIVRLSQVTPSGRVIMLADGVRRGRFVTGTDAIRPMTPGQVVPFDVEVGPVSFVLPRNHAVRVSIQTTSSPRYEPNPGVATPLAQNPTPVAYDLTVYRDPAHPTSVTLPVVSGAFPVAGGSDAGVPDAAMPAPPDSGAVALDDAGDPPVGADAGGQPTTDDAGVPATKDGGAQPTRDDAGAQSADGATIVPLDGSTEGGADTGGVAPIIAPMGCSCSAGGSGVPAFLVLGALALGLSLRARRRR